jgi:hypothetical protein
LVEDARGRRCRLIDPLALHLLRRHDVIEAPVLEEIVDDIAPGQSGRLAVAVGTGATLAMVLAAGQFLYHRMKGGWGGVDGPSLIIWTLQLGFCFGLAVVVWREGRAAGRRRALAVLLGRRRCAQCGFDLAGSPADPTDGATVCPECGAAWRLPAEAAPPPRVEFIAPVRKVVLVGALSVLAMIALIVFVLRMIA